MVERSRRKRRVKQPLLGNHQRCWLWGRHIVLETLNAGKWPILELQFAQELSEEERLVACRLAEELHVAYSLVPSETLAKSCGSGEHQGYLAKMPPYPYDEEDSLKQPWPKNPSFLLLDGVQDPYNFGAILRSAEVLGIDAVVIGTQNQVGVTSQVARSSAGAVNYIKIIQAADLCQVLQDWKARGVRILARAKKRAFPFKMSIARNRWLC